MLLTPRIKHGSQMQYDKIALWRTIFLPMQTATFLLQDTLGLSPAVDVRLEDHCQYKYEDHMLCNNFPILHWCIFQILSEFQGSSCQLQTEASVSLSFFGISCWWGLDWVFLSFTPTMGTLCTCSTRSQWLWVSVM